MLDRLGTEESCLGALYASCGVVGTFQQILCKQLKVNHDIRITVGTGGNPANAVAMGVLNWKESVVSLGISGAMIMSGKDMDFEGKGKSILFSANHTQFVNIVQGTVCSAGGAHRWWMENIIGVDDMVVDQQLISSDRFGKNSILFFPNITGGGLMYYDLCVKGALIGLSFETRREDMIQAVFKGVNYAICEVLEGMKLAQWPSRIQINGGGIRSPVWMQIMADVLRTELKVVAESATPGYGAAPLTVLINGISEREVCIGQGKVYAAEKVFTDAYDRQYKKCKRMHNTLKNIIQE